MSGSDGTIRETKPAPRRANDRGHDSETLEVSMPATPYRPCPSCGDSFLPHHRQQIYCSKSCQIDGAAKERTCEECGESFKARQEHRGYRRRFCSAKCSGQAEYKKRVAKYPPREEVVRLYVDEGLSDKDLGRRFGRSHQWSLCVRRFYGIPGRPKGDSKVSRKPLSQKRDRRRWAISMKREPVCRNCEQAAEIMHLHHAVPRSHSRAGKYDLRNGLPLCHRCHTGWHQMGVNIYRDVFTAEEWSFIQTLTGEEWLDRRYPVRPSDGGTLLTSHCQKGHLLEGSNLSILPSGKRRCKTCQNLRAAEYRARKKAA